MLNPLPDSVHIPLVPGSVLGPGHPAVAGTVLCPRTALSGSQAETEEVGTSSASLGAQLSPARFLKAILVTAEALQTEPCPQGGTQTWVCVWRGAHARVHESTRARAHARAKAGAGAPRGGGRPAERVRLRRPAAQLWPGRRLPLSPSRGRRPAKHFRTCLGPIPECEAIPPAPRCRRTLR